MPARIQRLRTAGWRVPRDAQGRPAIYVGRNTRWGNPSRIIDVPGGGYSVAHDNGGSVGIFATKAEARRLAAQAYRHHLEGRPDIAVLARRDLAGRDLMCWCPLPEPGRPDHCHAAVLLDIAN